MKPSAEMISSLVWVLLGLGICLYSVRLQLWTAAGPGSGLLPFVAGLIIGLFGLALLLAEWSRRRRGRRPAPFWADAAARNRVGLVVAGLGAMAYLMPILGFLLAASLVMTFLLGRLRAGDERAMFQRFLDIEEGHHAIVLAELDSVQGLGYWFDVQESHLEAG